jgi:hypothetical protein
VTANVDEPHIGLVVEGRGEIESLPLLLRRQLHTTGEWRDILGKPIPCHGREKALRRRGIEGYVATAASRPGCRAVIVTLDAETDAACELGPNLLERSKAVTDTPVAICLAEPKFEGWLVASAETLEIPGLEYRTDRDPAGLIRHYLDAKYVKPTWQPRLTARLDIELASGRSQSLARLLAKLAELARLI